MLTTWQQPIQSTFEYTVFLKLLSSDAFQKNFAERTHTLKTCHAVLFSTQPGLNPYATTRISSDMKVYDHATSIGVTCSQHVGSPSRYSSPNSSRSWVGTGPIHLPKFPEKMSSPRWTRTSVRPVVRSQGMMP